jgi:hypothetical protein
LYLAEVRSRYMDREIKRFRILDHDADRIILLEKTLQSALTALGMRGGITCISDSLHIAREGVLARVPVIEIEGSYWSLRSGRVPEMKDLIELVKKTMNL